MTQLNHTQVWDEKFTVCKLPPPKTKTESSFCFLLLGIFKLENFENGELVQKNAVFMDYLQNGIEVRYFDNGEERSSIVYLVDYNNVDNNSFIVANQWTFIENSNKRPDIILFLNGLPVVLIELKSPSREETDASEAYMQIRNYMQEIPSIFIYNAFMCVYSYIKFLIF